MRIVTVTVPVTPLVHSLPPSPSPSSSAHCPPRDWPGTGGEDQTSSPRAGDGRGCIGGLLENYLVFNFTSSGGGGGPHCSLSAAPGSGVAG